MSADASEVQPVTPSVYACKLLTAPWYRAVRWLVPVVVLAAVVIIIGPGSLPNGFSLITLLILAGSNLILRRLPGAISRWHGDANLSNPLLTLRDDRVLQLTLEHETHSVDLTQCDDLRIHRVLWWITPALTFVLTRRDGYELRLTTYIDIPEFYAALRTVRNDVLPRLNNADTTGKKARTNRAKGSGNAFSPDDQ